MSVRTVLVAALIALLAPGLAAADKSAAGKKPAEKKEIVKVTAAEAAARGLPRYGVSIDVTGSGCTVARLPDKTTFLRLSGPPGGPLGLLIRSSRTASARPKWLGQLVQREVPDRGLKLGAKATLVVDGKQHPAIAYTTGASLARAHGCLIDAFSSPKQDGLLILFWISAGTSAHPGCAALARSGPFATLLPSLTIKR